MYLHIGKDLIVNSNDIIGIFNIDYVKNTREYKAMYKDLEENGKILNISEDTNKSFILIEKNKNKKGYITKISVNTIAKRLI